MAKGAVDGCGLNVLKYIMFAVNFVFWLAGGALMGVGIYALVEMKDYKEIFSSAGSLPVGVLILGIVVFIIGFLGCCGAIKESTGMLKVYFGFVVVLVIGEIVVTILAFVKKGDAENWVADNLRDGYVSAFPTSSSGVQPNQPTQDAIKKMQEEFLCCGVRTVNFAALAVTNPNFDAVAAANLCVTSTSLGAKKVVTGADPTGNLTCETTNTDVSNCIASPSNPTVDDKTCCTCYEQLKSWVEDNLVLVAGVAAGIAACQIFSLIFTCCLISGIQKSAYA